MYRRLLGILAAGHRAGLHRAHFVPAVRRNVGVTVLRGMVMAVNRALVASAAGTGHNHEGGAGYRRIDEQESEHANSRSEFSERIGVKAIHCETFKTIASSIKQIRRDGVSHLNSHRLALLDLQ